jgi:formate hydrogenlyase subunit 5
MDVFTNSLITHLESKQCTIQFEYGREGEYYLRLSLDGLSEAASWLTGRSELMLIDMWVVKNNPGFELFYAFELNHPAPILIITLEIEVNQAPSISGQFPMAIYFERKISDLFGLDFTGLPDTRRLLLHEEYPEGFHPMIHSDLKQLIKSQELKPASEYVFKPFEGEGIYQVPVGPVHAGVIEPGHFRFSVMGETIFNLETRLGYKHRGLCKLAQGKSVKETLQLAETISGDESAANACCFAMAVEKIASTTLPRRAWELRTLLLEMERVYCHLGDLAGMLVDVAYPVGASPFFVLREEIMRWNYILVGSRFLKGAIIPGGLSKDIDDEKLSFFNYYLAGFSKRLEQALSRVEKASIVIDRFDTTGIVLPELITPLSLSGPVARASGYEGDTRQLHPYGLYNELHFKIPTKTAGDVLARFKVKAREIASSTSLMESILDNCKPGPVFVDCNGKSGQTLTAVEAPRGRNLHWLRLNNGKVESWEPLTASFCNWLALEHAAVGNILPDFPVINKSFNLSYAGNDL